LKNLHVRHEDALDEYHQEGLLRGQDAAGKDVKAKQAARRTGGLEGLLQYQLAAALRAYEHENGSALKVASAYGDLRPRDEAMKFLGVARQRHDLWLTSVEIAPEFRWRPADPEFRQLVVELGLPAVR
jgi:hypothetical protein